MNRIMLAEIFSNANMFFICMASLVWCVLHILSPIISKIVFAGFGYNISLKNLVAIHISRLPARYLPGGIWHTVGRYSDYRSFGTSKKHLTLLAIIETLFPCVTTLFIGGGAIWVINDKSLIFSIAGGMSLISFCFLLVIPMWIKLNNSGLLARKLYIQYVKLTFTSIVFWVIASISFLFYYSSVAVENNGISLLQVAATYIFSWGVGYIAIFAPQGIGIFEIVAGKLMEIPLTIGGAMSFIAGFRVVVLIADVVSWTIFRLCISLDMEILGCSTRKKTSNHPSDGGDLK